MNVLFHINDGTNWNMLLGNVKNMLKYGKENGTAFEIEVVANGNAVTGLLEHVAKESSWYSDMSELHRDGVVFAACNNALNTFNVDCRPLCAFAAVVPAGVVEIAKKQQEGFSYIKP